MMREDLQKIQDELDEVKRTDARFEGKLGFASYIQTSNMHKENLQRKFARRSRQAPFGETLYLELEDYRIPGILDKAIHPLGVHPWIDADHVKWGSVRVCPLCGRCEWTIYPREIGGWKEAPVHYCAGALMEFIKNWKEMNQ